MRKGYPAPARRRPAETPPPRSAIGCEQVAYALDRSAHHRHHGIASPGEAERRREHVARAAACRVAQEAQPAIEGAGYYGREQPVARHQVETELPVRRAGRRLRRNSLGADHLNRILPGAVQDDRQVAARAVQMRLHDLEREAGRML